jgi:uncharacterized protein (DUF885 family)
VAQPASPVYDLSNAYIERWARLDPIGATSRGIPGHDTELTDFSPNGAEARAELDRSTLRALSTLPRGGERDRLAADVMRERLEAARDRNDAGEWLRDLRVIGSPVQAVRQCFDLMPTNTQDDWETIAARMSRVPAALEGLRTTLRESLQRGVTAARRQALACAEQARVWSGDDAGTRPFFVGFLDKHDPGAGGNGTLRRRLEEGAVRATQAYAELARFLREDYAPRAEPRDPAGAERYALLARSFTGLALDLRDTYAWGWGELRRIDDRMRTVAARIRPGASLPEVIELLEADPARAITGEQSLRQWLQDLMDRTVRELDGTHFDIPDPVKRVEAMIAPPGGAAAMYYTRPSEDFKRPGRTWYPTLGKTRFPLWGEVSTAYHEGVPGHHLQMGMLTYIAGDLSRFQRLGAFVPGHTEGWALYAERLMDELGYLENPDYELGMLRAQALRAMRVVVDLGMHLELPIPKGEAYHPGEIWNAELALPFAIERSYEHADFIRSEIDRYLGWPAQAICYKVGERVWLQVREAVQRRDGAEFSLRDFHARALRLGPMGLEQLRREFGA